MYRRFAVVLVLLGTCVPKVHGQSEIRDKTVLDGVYSDAQAERGRSLYTTHCSVCHGSALEGVSAPSLTGNRFVERWREGSLDNVYNFIRQTMPFQSVAT